MDNRSADTLRRTFGVDLRSHTFPSLRSSLCSLLAVYPFPLAFRFGVVCTATLLACVLVIDSVFIVSFLSRG
jgi:hypothetical protein